MHRLIDEKMVERIRTTGYTLDDPPDRVPIMESLNLRYDRPAENVVIMGCQNIKLIPAALHAFARILERGRMSYTFLSNEYCCGNYLYRPAIKGKDEDAMAECRSLSREFCLLNIAQAKRLGASRLILFCSPCYPIYKSAVPTEDIIFYPQAISEIIDHMKWPEEIDYYAGCYKLHRNLANFPMDLRSTNEVLRKVQGLSINRIGAPACCFKPDGLAYMLDHVKTGCMVHICTGCYLQAHANMPKDKKVKILMLPEFIDMIQKGG